MNSPYVPIHALPYWSELGPFVRACVSQCHLVDRSESALFAATTPLVLWAWQSRGMVLEVPVIFASSTIEQFVHLGMSDYLPGSRATIRSTLWRMRETLNPGEAVRRTRPISRSAATIPYSPAEVAALYGWAVTQATQRRRIDATVLLALGLGAGLATREILAVTGHDLRLEDGAASVAVRTGRTRLVPLRHEWVASLTRLDIPTGSDAWLFRPGRHHASDGQVTDFLMRARTSLDVRPARMRATWLRTHLDLGTSPLELLRISGLKNLAALDRLPPLTLPQSSRDDRRRPSVW